MTKQEINNMSHEEFLEKLTKLNTELKKFGWERGLCILAYERKGTSLHKENQHANKHKKPVQINYLAIIAQESPDLIKELIRNKEIKIFIELVSEVEMYMEIFMKNFPAIIWPADLC